MSKPTLVVLAAGMASRYGSLKQMDGVGPSGEAIIDYSIYDAVRAGFGKVVFVIRSTFADSFKAAFPASRFGGKIEVDFVYQELDKLPAGFTVPAERVKPWGTNHAIMMCEDAVSTPFAVINADDFYGYDAFKTMAEYLTSLTAEDEGRYCMVGYRLANTLSEFGTVSRGICSVDEQGNLAGMVEHLGIKRMASGKIYGEANGQQCELDENAVVSMNMFGFTPGYFAHSRRLFVEFLSKPETMTNLKSEFYIPSAVNALIGSGDATLKVLTCNAQWFGVTYKEDKPDVEAKIRKLIREGVYPAKLW